ncbi:MAG: TIGR04084 family radical SAM/SPASM domain-containing protein [Candidatus Hadarchaeales archaeon]
MFFHVILTTRCNLQCRYCEGESYEDISMPLQDCDYSLPERPAYALEELRRFLDRDPNPVVIFYGGEPLLALDLMYWIMESIPKAAFIVQTNGTLLNEVDARYLQRLHTIAVSIDGNEAQTDLNRGRGTFRRVIDNLKRVLELGFNGELIARMTVMEPLDIYAQVRWLIENDEFPFTSVHWQLNAGFWNDCSRRDFRRWALEVYNPGVRKLVRYWVDRMEMTGNVLRIYPLLGIAESLLKGERSELRCGAGWANYAIQTDGHVIPCPAMWGMRKYYLGHIGTDDPLSLRKVFVGEPCTSCDVLETCGGRCLYANVMGRWSAEDYEIVCRTVKNLVDAIAGEVPRIRSLINERVVGLEDFTYMKYNGCEIVP